MKQPKMSVNRIEITAYLSTTTWIELDEGDRDPDTVHEELDRYVCLTIAEAAAQIAHEIDSQGYTSYDSGDFTSMYTDRIHECNGTQTEQHLSIRFGKNLDNAKTLASLQNSVLGELVENHGWEYPNAFWTVFRKHAPTIAPEPEPEPVVDTESDRIQRIKTSLSKIDSLMKSLNPEKSDRADRLESHRSNSFGGSGLRLVR